MSPYLLTVFRIQIGASSISSSASVSSAGIRVRVGDSSASTSASVNAEGGLLAIATSSLQTFATIPDVTANFEVFATANPQPVATIAVEAEKLGELWGVY